MRSSYQSSDVELLLKDITGMVEPLPTKEREKFIQSGVHYCEMLPLEYRPSEKYKKAYDHALESFAEATAEGIAVIAEKIYARKNKRPVIVSLARAGIPIGILIKRYIKSKYNVDVCHYSISIIRGRGIDDNAMKYMLGRHEACQLQFVDGWTGKGAILRQLKEALINYPEVDASLAVVADPAGLTELCGTHRDILIPSSCLNATVTGLISRTFLRSDIIGEDDFHGAAFYGELEADDLSEAFLSAIEEKFSYASENIKEEKNDFCGTDIVEALAREYHIEDINFIKPGIGEATRVLLRRVPWKILLNEKYKSSDEIKHILQLAAEKNVDVEISRIQLGNYKVCGMIKQLSDV